MLSVSDRELPENLVVVDLAVEDDADRSIGREHWLVPGGGEVDDREPPEAESDAVIGRHERARIIGPAMPDRVAHVYEQRFVKSLAGLTVFIDAANAAHQSISRLPCGFRILAGS
jgi:hypothetical protein